MKTKTLKIILAAVTVVSLALAIFKYQGNWKQLGIARRSRIDCTWKLHQYILFEEVQRERGVRWRLTPAICVLTFSSTARQEQ